VNPSVDRLVDEGGDGLLGLGVHGADDVRRRPEVAVVEVGIGVKPKVE
jgi:hypothetical protein